MHKYPCALYLGLSMACTLPARAGWLLDNDQVTIGYKNYYWNEQSLGADKGYPAKSRREWVDAYSFDYFTGAVERGLALRYGAVYAQPLDVRGSADEVSNLPAGRSVNHPGTILGTRTAYVSYALPTEVGALVAGYGKQSRRSHLYKDSDTRIVNASSNGWDIAFNSQALQAYYTRFDRYTERNVEGWGDTLENFAGEKIDYLEYYGLEYEPRSDLKIALQRLRARNYIKENFARLYFVPKFSPDTRFIFTFGQQKDAGNLFETSGVGGYAPKADHLSTSWRELRLEHSLGGAAFALSYNEVRGDDYNRLLFKGDAGTWEGSGNGWSFYGLKNERTWTADIGWNMATVGFPGLRVQAIAKKSHGAWGYDGFARHELAGIVSYALQAPLDGFSVMLYLNRHRADGERDLDKRPLAVSGPSQLERKNVVRVYFTWQKTF